MSMIRVSNKTIELSNEDKVLFPANNITKEQLIGYYQFIAPYLIPLIKDHPIAMHRFPNGIDSEGFYQKDAGDYFPSWIKQAPIARLTKDKITHYVLCNDAATLIYLANQATITIHTWLSSAQKKNYPDRMIFDLDPPDEQHWALVKQTARALKKVLESYGLIPFVMTSGSKGLHVVVPLEKTATFAHVYQFARFIAQQVVNKNSDTITLQTRKDQRTNKLLIDILRNRWAQLSVAPYSVRAKNHAPIATPLHWYELANNKLHPQYYTINNLRQRLARINDPWRDFYACARSLPVIKKG